MRRPKKYSSLLAKYSLMYEKKPRSRVFAPLAETYRKLGMIDDALKILKDGIKNHPSYTLGYIVLGNCYFDLQNYEMSYNTIRPFVPQNLENIALQKLFAKTCINLGHLEEALQTFKYLLLLNPKDMDVADQIKLLEDDLLVSPEEEVEEFQPKQNVEFDEDDWVQVNFNRAEEDSNEEFHQTESNSQDDDLDSWSLEKQSPLESFKAQIQEDKLEVKEHTLDSDFFHEDFDNKSSEVISAAEDELIEGSEEKEKPIITHTLVDLYLNQGHADKAKEILANILELHPSDEKSKQRLDELNSINPEDSKALEEKLDAINPEPVKSDDRQDKVDAVEMALSTFLKRLQDRSAEKSL